jgi:hypothetical protein
MAIRPLSSVLRPLEVGFPIRRFTDQSLFAAPRDLSQRTTSFIASQRQGIHQTPFWHLIALIAKTRFSCASDEQRTDDQRIKKTLALLEPRRSAPSSDRSSRLKRPVLLQTHPGARAVSNEPTTGCLSDDETRRRRRTDVLSISLVLSSGNRTRFLFTMSDIGRLEDGRQRTEVALGRPHRPSFARKSRAHEARLPAKLIKMHRISRFGRLSRLGLLRRPSANRLVEPDGIEPTTSCLQSTRSPN